MTNFIKTQLNYMTKFTLFNSNTPLAVKFDLDLTCSIYLEVARVYYFIIYNYLNVLDVCFDFMV